MLGNVTFSQFPYSTIDSSLKVFNGEIYDINLYIQQKPTVNLMVVEIEEQQKLVLPIVLKINRVLIDTDA